MRKTKLLSVVAQVAGDASQRASRDSGSAGKPDTRVQRT